MGKIHDIIGTWANTLNSKERYPDSNPAAVKPSTIKKDLNLANKLIAAVEQELSKRIKFSKERPLHSETIFTHGIQLKPPKAPTWFVNECMKLNQGREIYYDKIGVKLIIWPNLIARAWHIKAQKPQATKLHLLEQLSKDKETRSDLPVQFITGKIAATNKFATRGDTHIALPVQVAKGLKAALRGKDLFEWYNKGKKYTPWSTTAPELNTKTLYDLQNPETSDKVIQHELRVNGIRRKFTVKQISAQRLPYFTYEGQTAHKVERLGINTPHFHGYVEQNGATIAFFDHIDGHNLAEHNFSEDDVKKFAAHIAERHAKGVVQTDPYLRNTLIDANGEFWMLDHEVTKVIHSTAGEKEKKEFERLRKREVKQLSQEIFENNCDPNIFQKEYNRQLTEITKSV